MYTKVPKHQLPLGWIRVLTRWQSISDKVSVSIRVLLGFAVGYGWHQIFSLPLPFLWDPNVCLAISQQPLSNEPNDEVPNERAKLYGYFLEKMSRGCGGAPNGFLGKVN